MSIATRVVRISASLVPPNERDRYYDEWLSDLYNATSMGLKPRHVALAALQMSLTTTQRKRFTMSLSPSTKARRGGLVVLAGFFPFIAAVIIRNLTFSLPLVVVSIAVGLLGFAILATASRQVLEKKWIPRAVYATLIVDAVVAAIAVIEMNLLFNGNDVHASQPVLQGLMTLTGAVGVLSIAAGLVFFVMLLVGLGRRGQRVSPGLAAA